MITGQSDREHRWEKKSHHQGEITVCSVADGISEKFGMGESSVNLYPYV
jgi:hypothetical protein